MKIYKWNKIKSETLQRERGISFENIVSHINAGHLVDIIEHPDKKKYPNQKIFIININNYIYMVPFVENDNGIFLKKIIPSRKLTKIYLKEE